MKQKNRLKHKNRKIRALKEIIISETKATHVAEENTTQRPTVRITTGDGSGETELIFSGVYTAAQAADILFDAGIITDKTEFYTYMYTTGYDKKCAMAHTDLNLEIHMRQLPKQLLRQNKKHLQYIACIDIIHFV